MLKSMPRKCRMVDLNVYFKIIGKAVFIQKTNHRCRIVIILVFAWLARFWFDEERAFEAILAGIIFGNMQKLSKVLNFTVHVRIQKRHITLTTSPENIAIAIQGNCGINGGFHLGSAVCQYMEIRVCSRSVHVA